MHSTSWELTRFLVNLQPANLEPTPNKIIYSKFQKSTTICADVSENYNFYNYFDPLNQP
jgi:hypothetical protein